jgi:hypothetical protein
MHPFYLELELIKPVEDFFKAKDYQIFREIKIGYCRADIVAINDKHTIAVELKLSDWKKALVQSKNYQLGADYVYIALPLMKSYNILRKAKENFENEGIGLLVVNEKTSKVKKIISPKKSKRKFCSISVEEIKKFKKRKSKRLFF